MNYDEALEYIHSAPKVSKKIGNAVLAQVLEKLENPHRKLKYVHIAGTNGKGSTSSMTESVLRAAGYKTGLFTSPYIERFNERIKVNGIDIPDADLSVLTQKVKDCLDTNKFELSEFAIIFVIGILYYLNQNCDIVVLETGLGGRLDATNIIETNEVCAITSISFDHTQYLGDTLEKIAYEKSGIIKPGSSVVVYNNPTPEIKQTISMAAKKQNAKLVMAGSAERVNGNKFTYHGCDYELSLQGKYQFSNAAVCLEIINRLKDKGYVISEEYVKQGLKSVSWPGRFEWISPNLILDGCHNEEGAKRFAEAVSEIKTPITIVTGVMNDKDYSSIAKILSKITDNIIVTKPDEVRALDPEEYKKEYEQYGVDTLVISNPEDAVKAALSHRGVCAVCGSLYLIGQIRKKFKNTIA